MTHAFILEQFKLYFPPYATDIKEWFPTGKNCIRVRLIDSREFIFTYEAENNLRLETVEHFLKRLKGE